MTFIEWLREQGYSVWDKYDIMEQLDEVEADELWMVYDASYSEEDVD